MLFPIICKIVWVEFVKFSKIVFIAPNASRRMRYLKNFYNRHLFSKLEIINYLLIPKLRINNQIFTPCSRFLAVFKLIN